MKYTLEIDEQQLNILWKIMDEQPHKIVRPLMDDFDKQLIPQIEAAKKEKK